MGKFIRLLRLKHQYAVVGMTLATAILLKTHSLWIIFWILACLFLSISAAIINELVDSQDADKYTSNDVHIKETDKFDMKTVWLIFGFFSLAGIFLSFLAGLFWFGIIIYVLGMLYSLKPIRLKGRFLLDNITQILAGLFIPVMGPIILLNKMLQFWPLILTFILLIWFCVFPYQLADFEADQKAGLRPTHVVIGMKLSLWLGMGLLTLGFLAYWKFGIIKIAWWSLIILPPAFYALYSYIRWLGMRSLPAQLASMRNYVRVAVPSSQLIVPYLLVIWLLT